MNEFFIYYSIIFLYGLVIGSFLNVCIYRIPGELSIVTGRSRCMSCNTPIKWYDLIPVLSYIFLLGRCRKCKSRISIQYPMIEALNGLLYVLVFYLYGFDSLKNILISGAYCLVISALIVLSVIDFRTNTIPAGINIFILIMGLLIVLLRYFWSGRNTDIVVDHVIGMFAVSLFLLLIFFVSHGRGIGGGDIKLMGAAGLVLGWELILLAFMLGCVLAAIIHPIRMRINHLNRVLAFGPYLSAGIAISLFFGKQMIDWYIQSFFL
jgi:leader peptidase (prepilin peptidase)/N-methyltransferase